MTDQPAATVDRVNGVVTTLLDALGVLLLAAGLGWGAWQVWGIGWGLCAAGLAVTILSNIAQLRQAPRPVKVPPGAHPHREFLPGPEDPGPVHVKGR